MTKESVCVSICAETAAEMRAQAMSVVPHADVIELRLDCLHPDELAQLNDVAPDVVSITDEVGIAILEVDGGAKAPCLAGSYHVLDR